MKRKALVFVLAALGCVAIVGGGRAVAGESGRGVLQRGVAAQKVVDVVNFTAEPLFVVGETRITGAGGLRLPSLSLGAKSRLVIDPVRTPIFVASAPSFAPGAKIALAERYAGVKRGRIVLATWGGNADIPDGLFDAASVIGKAVVTVETAPDGKSRQLVATIGDYDSSPELRIVALGDSITQGIQKPEQKESGFPQYRTSLAALLAANGVKAQMLGTRTHSQFDAAGVQAPKEWTGHFGWSGITTGGLLCKKSNWVADGEVPDVVTMLIGTNDINHKKRDIRDKGKSSEKAVSEIYKSWKKLVDAVAARWPDAKIICGTILDRDFYGEGPIGHELAVAVNDLIRADCKAGRLPKNFVLVDLYEKCPLAEEGVFFKDKLHPNWKGHMLMAEAFFDSVWRRGKALVEPTAISLVTSEHGRMNGENADPNTIKVKLAPGGGFAAKFTPASKSDATPYVVEAPASAKLVFDTSNAPDLRKWTEEKFAPAMCEWVVKLTDIMASDGWEPPKDILFKFVVEPLQWDTNAPAWASSTEGRVSLRVDWFRKNLNGEALGATIHELTHIMQAYWTKGHNKDNCPDWAVEGYADYIRWILFEPEADGCGYVRKNIKKYHYNDSYRVTAHFFGFVESRYPGTMKKLNAAMRDHTFDNGKFWKDATGKTVEDLEADWKSDAVGAATTPKVEDFKVKLTGVAIMPTDDDEEDEGKSKVLPPQTRIVVTPGNLAVFFLEYSFPPNVKSRMYLGPNFDEGVLGEDPFGTSASGLLSGKGKITKIVLFGAGGDEPYEKDLLLKSVRIRGELEAEEGAPRNNSFFICDMPVNVLFANKADSDGKGAVVLSPKPSPTPDPKLGVVPFDKNAKPKSSTPKGFTDNLDEALAKAKKEGKFVYVCFSGSDWCGWCKMLEREVFAQPEFVPAVEKDYVLVFIDSPSNKGVLSARAKKENPKLVKKYGIAGFPTALILDGDGNKVGETGYRKGGAKAYVEHLLDIKGKRQVP